LKDRINKQEQKGALIIGIPRGGVITADIVAKKLSADFEIVIPRKLTDQDNKEHAIGAIMEDGTTYLDQDVTNHLQISSEYMEKEKSYQMQEITRRASLFRKPGLQYNVKGKTVILVDDGVATGATIIAAARWIRKQQPSRLIIAVPVAPKDTINLLKEECDAVEVITNPSNFHAVGQYYQSFDPVTDEQVIKIMQDRNLLPR